MNGPLTISIDRRSRTWAVFDAHFACVKEFEPWLADEAQALAEAKAWVAERSPMEPEVVYPRITRLELR